MMGAASSPPLMIVDPCTADASTRAAWRCRGGVLAELADFLEAWESPEPTMELQTSGSTGRPARLQASKAAMRASAEMSCRAFGLQAGDKALLCLPLRYIAGKMMVVRALVARLRLVVVEPCGNPLAASELEGVTLDFAPLVPMQVARCLAEAGACERPKRQEGPGSLKDLKDLKDVKGLKGLKGLERLERVRTLLLGGGFIEPELEEALQGLRSCRVYASYGMTETLSHIALRRVNGPSRSECYRPLPGVTVALGTGGTLCIDAPHLGVKGLETNDLAELEADGGFRILGRRDAVINSGGIKVQAEELERQLHAATGLTLIAVPRAHAELGQCVALLWEGEAAREETAEGVTADGAAVAADGKVAAEDGAAESEDERRLLAACAALPRYHRPRLVQRVERLPRTQSGKLARAACRELAATFALGA